jgi:tripartite-type tricarboxylate transporter receptor subunit TctC
MSGHGKRPSLVLSLALALSLPIAASAQTVEQAFKGKVINLYIGTGAGGVFDFYGRLAATHLGRHIPGHPSIVPQNMPGAGGINMANFLFHRAPKDGTALGLTLSGVALLEAVEQPGVQYKTAEFNWLGRLNANTDITIMSRNAKVQSAADATRIEAVIAGATPGSGASVDPRGPNAFAGTKFKIISGYETSTAGMLALERGEVEGATTTWDTLKRTKEAWLRDKLVTVILQYTVKRHPELASVPTSVELGRTAEDKQLLTLYATGATAGASLAAPPELPGERVAALRAAFDAMTRDPQFLADIARSGAEFNEPLGGAQLQQLLADLLATSPALRQRAKQAYE